MNQIVDTDEPNSWYWCIKSLTPINFLINVAAKLQSPQLISKFSTMNFIFQDVEYIFQVTEYSFQVLEYIFKVLE